MCLPVPNLRDCVMRQSTGEIDETCHCDCVIITFLVAAGFSLRFTSVENAT